MTARGLAGRSTRFCGQQEQCQNHAKQNAQRLDALLFPHPLHLPPCQVFAWGFSEPTAVCNSVLLPVTARRRGSVKSSYTICLFLSNYPKKGTRSVSCPLTKVGKLDIIKDRRALLQRSAHLTIQQPKPLTVRVPAERSTRCCGE